MPSVWNIFKITYIIWIYIEVIIYITFIQVSKKRCFKLPNLPNQPKSTPLNPEFLHYLRLKNTNMLQTVTKSGHTLGTIPAPVKIPQIKAPLEPVSYPTHYDLRDYNKVTPVKDQGGLGSCWSFATYGSLESNLLPREIWDFSENNLINTHGFDPAPGEGGTHLMSSAYLSRWSGPISETADPYRGYISPSPPGLIPKKHVQEVLFLTDRTFCSLNSLVSLNPLDVDILKSALINHGAVYCHFYWDDTYYNLFTSAYYCNAEFLSNHAVTLVGWDDNYSKDNFSPNIPAGNGAFIIKNSWGTFFGDNGYNYISYYDVNFNGTAIFNNAESIINYNKIYQYDTLGWSCSVYYENSFDLWMANIFRTNSRQLLKAAGFYSLYPDTNYEIYIYTNVTDIPTRGSLAGRKSGTMKTVGYHTVPLDNTVLINANTTFSIVIKLNTPGNISYGAYEANIPGYSSQAVINPGESYVSLDGNDWYDMSQGFGNVCIKALA
jgi:C1A family cysteine protease